MNLGDLKSIFSGLGPIPEINCDLPPVPSLEEIGTDIIETGSEVFTELSNIAPKEGVFISLRNFFSEYKSQGIDFGLNRVDLKPIIEEIGNASGLMPESTPKETQKAYLHLMDLLDAHNELFLRETIRITIRGDSDTLDKISQSLGEDLADLAQDFMVALANDLGWRRGQTWCCDRMGYMPPEGSRLLPVHDVEEPKNAGSETGFDRTHDILRNLSSIMGLEEDKED